MPTIHPCHHLPPLHSRVVSLPDELREVWGRPDFAAIALELADELLADLDALLTEALEGTERGLPWLRVGEQAAVLKGRVYGVFLPMLAVRSVDLTPLRRFMHRDLADTQQRLDAVAPVERAA